MLSKYLTILFCIIYIPFLNSQAELDKIYASFGYSAIPLHIDRTDITRWMVFPTFETGYRINEKLSINASYLGQDVTLKRSTLERQNLYKEVPVLTSYEEALSYQGKKFTISHFSDYIFAGFLYENNRSKSFILQTNLQIGFRFGETSLLTNISEQPSWPNGFEVHETILSSNSPGLKLAISPKVLLWDFVFIEVSIGSFVFINWPTIQPFGSTKFGISF